MQALDKMDKAGALGAASDRSKPVSWDGAALQVSSTCSTYFASEVVLPCGGAQYRALPWIYGSKLSVASSVHAAGCGIVAVQITGCRVWRLLTPLTLSTDFPSFCGCRSMWASMCLAAARPEPRVTRCASNIRCIASLLQLDARALCTRDTACVHPGVAPVLSSAPYTLDKFLSAGQRGRAGAEGHSDQPGAERREREQTSPSTRPAVLCVPALPRLPERMTLICVQPRPLNQQGRKPPEYAILLWMFESFQWDLAADFGIHTRRRRPAAPSRRPTGC